MADIEEDKKEQMRIKNQISAFESRLKKRIDTHNLEQNLAGKTSELNMVIQIVAAQV